jgi:acylphosphatase
MGGDLWGLDDRAPGTCYPRSCAPRHGVGTVTLYFAYGSNMSRALMSGRCPGASALGVATLAGWRFVITPDGVGSIARRSGNLAYGVLWRLTARDVAALNAYESLDSGLYVRRMMAVEHAAQRRTALIYWSTRPGVGRARPGYINLVVDAARDWGLPEAYIRSLKHWSLSGWRGARIKDTGEVGTAMSDERNGMSTSPQTICRLVIRGRVQRVGYRAWTEETAHTLGLEGWVRNRRDGAVEAVFAGPAASVATMIAACRRGPPAAVVDDIDQRDGSAEDLALRRPGERFSALPTA